MGGKRRSGVRLAGRPKRLPSALARLSPAWVRSISRSRSNSATALITFIVSLPVELARSTPPSARQWTRIPIPASLPTVEATSVALRPSPVEQAREAAAPGRGDAAGDRLGHDPARLDGEAGRREFPELVVGGLADGGHADVGEDARHGRIHPKRMPGT